MTTRRLLFWLGLASGLVLFYLQDHPIRLGTTESESEGAPIAGAVRSDVMVVVSPDQILHSAELEEFDAVDWSWAWVDFLEAEIGPVQVVSTSGLSADALAGVRFVVITHSAVSDPATDDLLLSLEQFCNRGGVLVLDRPAGRLRETFSADGRGGLRRPRMISHAAGVSEEVSSALQALPLFTRYVGSTGPLAGAETLLAMDGAPVIYRLSRASGSAVTIDFDLGSSLVSLQQGRPSGIDFDLETRSGSAPNVADLVADPALLEAELPYADLLEYFVVYIALGTSAPLAGIWPYPGGVDGVVLLSHDVPHDGDKAAWLPEHEHDLGASSSFFLGYGANPTPEAAGNFLRHGAGLGVLWQRGHDRRDNRRPVGALGIHPFYRIASLHGQLQRVLDAAGQSYRILGGRSEGGEWSDDWAGSLRVMSALGLRFDSSYGLWGQDPLSSRFPFGTGRPFMTLDQNGLPLGIYEVPVLITDLSSPETIEHLEDLLRMSQRRAHQVIGVHIPGDFLYQSSGMQVFDTWERLLTMARERNHLVLDIESFIRFRIQRAQSGLTTRVTSETQSRAEIEVQVEAGADDMWVRLPEVLGRRRLRDVRLVSGGDDDAPFEVVQRDVSMYGIQQVLLSVPMGDSTLEVVYR